MIPDAEPTDILIVLDQCTKHNVDKVIVLRRELDEFRIFFALSEL